MTSGEGEGGGGPGEGGEVNWFMHIISERYSMEQSIDLTRLDRQVTSVTILHIRFTKSTQSIVTVSTLFHQELIVSINWLSIVSIVSIDTIEVDCSELSEELIASIKWLSNVFCLSTISIVSIDTIERAIVSISKGALQNWLKSLLCRSIDCRSSQQELILSINCLSIISIDRLLRSKGAIQSWLKSWLLINWLSIVSIDTIEGRSIRSKVDRYDRRAIFRARVDCVDRLTVGRVDRIDRVDRRGLFRARVGCVDQLAIDRIDDSVDQLSVDRINRIDRYDRMGLFTVDWRSVSTVLIELIEGGSSKQELVVSIKWLSIVSIEVGSSEQELVVSINWLSIVSVVSIDTIEGRYSEQELMVSCLSIVSIDTIEGGSSEQELILSINWLSIISIMSISMIERGYSELKSWLCLSTDFRSYRSTEAIQSTHYFWLSNKYLGTIDRFDNFHRSITVDITIDLNQQNLSIVSIVPYPWPPGTQYLRKPWIQIWLLLRNPTCNDSAWSSWEVWRWSPNRYDDLRFLKSCWHRSSSEVVPQAQPIRCWRNINDWLCDFHINRKMQVVVDGDEPDAVSVDPRVPQGMVLGPLSFLCHINDLPDALMSKFPKRQIQPLDFWKET